jgi:hypothetical protein
MRHGRSSRRTTRCVARPSRRPRPTPGTSGYALIELVSALATLAALLIVTGALFHIAGRTAAVVGDRAAALDAVRTATALLDRELRPLAPADFLVAADSVSLRVFRGIAIPCDSTGGALRVRYAGVRDPDASKDSVLALAARGESVAALQAVARATTPGTCASAAGETILALTTPTPLPTAPVLLVFERGAYSIGGGALRYRRGLGGRQPLTAAAFDDGPSGFTGPAPASRAAAEVVLAGASRAPTFALPARARIPLANHDSVLRP